MFVGVSRKVPPRAITPGLENSSLRLLPRRSIMKQFSILVVAFVGLLGFVTTSFAQSTI
jgi:hypothetical protein